jgi:uncharacterized protein YjgD (DUF1641 family)
MLHKSTKIIASIGTLFFLVSVTIGTIFFYIVEKQKAQFIERKIERAQMQANEESLASLFTRLENTADARASLMTRIVREEDVINLLALIESIGKEQNTKLTTNTLVVEPINNTFEMLVARISVEGSYDSVMQVLKVLEHLPYQSSVNNVQLVRNEGESISSWTGIYEVRVTKFKKI